MRDLWYLHRRLVFVGGGLLAGLVVLLLIAGLLVRVSGGRHEAGSRVATPRRQSASTPSGREQPSAAPATDVEQWNAMPSVAAATSAAYPAISAGAQSDPSAFAAAFATELFTRDYRISTRDQLISWAQYEDAPLQSPNYPKPDWTKVLVDSLTDLTWDEADDTAIPAQGPWLALAAVQTKQSVSDVKVQLDPQWEQKLQDGYEPPDPLATVRDVTLTVSQTSMQSGHPVTHRYSVSLAVQLGRSPLGGYGVAATNNYVSKES